MNMSWIKTSERRPLIGQYVLGYFPGYNVPFDIVQLLFANDKDDQEWETIGGHIVMFPTHWAFIVPPEEIEG